MTPTADIWTLTVIPQQGEALFTRINKGFSTKVLVALAKQSGLTKAKISDAVALAPATVSRRMESGVFTRDESDRVYRFVQQLSAATAFVEGNTSKAGVG